MSKLAACIDIGGTQARLGFVTPDGHILARQKIRAPNELGPAALVANLAERLRQLAVENDLDWNRVVGVGYSTAGIMDVLTGMMFASPNQGRWREVNFLCLLSDAFGLPVCIEMDANAAALGEAWLGAGSGCQHFIYLIVGTGVGCGLYLDGNIYHGWRGMAGEGGHITIEPDGPPCSCGNYGCLEALAAGPALAARAQAAIQQGRATRIAEIANGMTISANMVFQAAREGDEVADYLVAREADYIAIGIANLITLLNPQRVVLGGGVSLGGADLLLDPIRRSVRRRCGSWVAFDPAQIVISQLGDDAGLLGAAKLIFAEVA